MKRSTTLTFGTDEEWAAYHEAMRKMRKRDEPRPKREEDASKVASLCRDYLDRPTTPQSGEKS